MESLDRISREDPLSAQAQLINLLQAGIIIVTLIDKQVYKPGISQVGVVEVDGLPRDDGARSRRIGS